MMSTVTNEQISTEEYSSLRDEQQPQRNSSRHSTPNSSGGDTQFHFGSNNNNIERGSGQNSRTSSVAESVAVTAEGFSNYTEIIQHLQRVWNNHHNTNEGSRRTAGMNRSTNDANNNETTSSHYSKGYSQQHYTHHQSGQQHNNQYSGQQYWTNYNNPRRSGNSGNYSRGYHSGNNEGYWNQKQNRFPHRSMNSLMTNSTNYQQQSQPSPPTQRRQGDIQQQQQHHHNEQQQQPSQPYYKKNRFDHDRRSNGYNPQQQQSSDYSSSNNPHQTTNSVQTFQPTPSEQSNLSSTQSFSSNLNSYNR